MINLQKYVSNKEFGFEFEQKGRMRKVKVKMPDLSKSGCTVWGDWGPMYCFSLEEEDRVEISYDGKSHFLLMDKIKVESPMSAKLRDRCPFKIVLNDLLNCVNFHLYLDDEYDLTRVEAVDVLTRTSFYENEIKEAI